MNMALSEDQQFRSDWYAGTACRIMTLIVTARRRVSHGARRRRGKIGRRVVTLARCAWSAEPTNRAVPLGQRLCASSVAPLLVVASHSSAPRSCHQPSSRLGEGRRMTLLGPGLEDAARDIPHCTLIDQKLQFVERRRAMLHFRQRGHASSSAASLSLHFLGAARWDRHFYSARCMFFGGNARRPSAPIGQKQMLARCEPTIRCPRRRYSRGVRPLCAPWAPLRLLAHS